MTRRILLVSPEEDRRRLMEATLVEAGYDVTPESNQAVALTRVHDDTPDAVVIDISPGHDGAFHLVHGARESRNGKVADLPIVVSASRNLPADRIRAWEFGCDAWISRPHHMREVVAALTKLLELSPATRSKERAERFEDERRQVGGRQG